MATLRTQGPSGRGGDGPAGRSASAIPQATVARLPVYLRALRTLADRGTATASSEELGVIAGPPHAAQEVADRLVAAGITPILNFAPAVVTVPPGVDLRKVDLSIELQILAFHEQRKTADPAAAALLRGARGVRRLREDPV